MAPQTALKKAAASLSMSFGSLEEDFAAVL
jgi:hypothetical protein